MSKPNPNLVKIHRNYTVEEIAELFGISNATVRGWVKKGLPICEGAFPWLILGGELKAFLKQQRVKKAKRCADNEMYCLRCRAPRQWVSEVIEVEWVTPSIVNLKGFCVACGGLMNRRMNATNARANSALSGVAWPLVKKPIDDKPQPSLINHTSEVSKNA